MDLRSSPLSRPARKRKAAVSSNKHETDDSHELHGSGVKTSKKIPTASTIDVIDGTQPKGRKRKTSIESNVLREAKRLRRHRARAPSSYLEVKSRALTQRLTVLLRERCGSDELPEEKVLIAGSTGNIYTVNIGLVPSCNCPHAKKGNQCKHIVYIMLRVLKAREHVAYQLALTGTELRELIENAPLIPGVETNGNHKPGEEQDDNRKPIEGECPICYDGLNPASDEIVYCKASCGNNVHRACMQSWIQVAARGKATCPYCRSSWDTEDAFNGICLGDVDVKGLQKNEDGFLNVAGQLGLSGERDYSTYHKFWVRRHLGSRR